MEYLSIPKTGSLRELDDLREGKTARIGKYVGMWFGSNVYLTHIDELAGTFLGEQERPSVTYRGCGNLRKVRRIIKVERCEDKRILGKISRCWLEIQSGYNNVHGATRI